MVLRYFVARTPDIAKRTFHSSALPFTWGQRITFSAHTIDFRHCAAGRYKGATNREKDGAADACFAHCFVSSHGEVAPRPPPFGSQIAPTTPPSNRPTTPLPPIRIRKSLGKWCARMLHRLDWNKPRQWLYPPTYQYPIRKERSDVWEKAPKIEPTNLVIFLFCSGFPSRARSPPINQTYPHSENCRHAEFRPCRKQQRSCASCASQADPRRRGSSNG